MMIEDISLESSMHANMTTIGICVTSYVSNGHGDVKM